MRTLLRVFSRFILKTTAIYVVASLVGIIALDRLFGGFEFYLGMLVFIAPLLAWGMTFMLVPKNLDWIMVLPISKRNVLLLHYLTGVFTSVVMFIASLFVLIMLVLIKRTEVNVAQVAGASSASVIGKDWLGPILAGIDIYGWMTALLMASFFHALSMSISRPAATKRFYLNLWNHVSPALRWTIRMGWVLALGLAAVFREFLLSPFGVFVLAISAFLIVTTLNTANALALPRLQRRRWVSISALLAFAQIAFLFLHATNGVRSGSFDRRVASVMFLGPFSGGMAKADLARLLEADINHERFGELAELYRDRFWNKKRVRQSQDADLSFKRAVASKRTFQDVAAVVKLFEPSDLNFDDLKVFFTKLQPLMSECRCDYPGYELLAAKLNGAEVTQLMENGEDVAAQFALLWTRYHAKPADVRLVRAIERRMPRLSDAIKLSALTTLSVVKGRRYQFEDWTRDVRVGRALSSAGAANGIYTAGCDQFVGKPLDSFTARDASALNYCVRHHQNGVSYAAEIESAGWVEPPFDAKTRATLRKTMRLK